MNLRKDCGYVGIDASMCYRRGCCWDMTTVNANFSGCFYPEGENLLVIFEIDDIDNFKV